MYGQPGYGQQTYGTPTIQPLMQPMGQPMTQSMMQPVVQPVMTYQPVYPYMPQPQQNNRPIIINLDHGRKKNLSYCQLCQHETEQIPRKTIGCVAIAWCLCLFVFTGIFCLYPCLADRLRDT